MSANARREQVRPCKQAFVCPGMQTHSRRHYTFPARPVVLLTSNLGSHGPTCLDLFPRRISGLANL